MRAARSPHARRAQFRRPRASEPARETAEARDFLVAAREGSWSAVASWSVRVARWSRRRCFAAATQVAGSRPRGFLVAAGGFLVAAGVPPCRRAHIAWPRPRVPLAAGRGHPVVVHGASGRCACASWPQREASWRGECALWPRAWLRPRGFLVVVRVLCGRARGSGREPPWSWREASWSRRMCFPAAAHISSGLGRACRSTLRTCIRSLRTCIRSLCRGHPVHRTSSLRARGRCCAAARG
ncbi:hypothetical protein APR12_005650 [Nocardia amikacinitolerans]|nr:hypothetical protein [Nocardia amikacinitolerans]